MCSLRADAVLRLTSLNDLLPWGRKQVQVRSCSWVCFVLVGEVAGAAEAGAAGEEEVVVLWGQLAVFEVGPGDVAVVAVAPAGLAVATDLGVVDCVVESVFSPPCDRKRSCDCVSKFSS